MGMMQEFKDFAVKGNVIDLAVGVIIGGAFGKIVGSLVEDRDHAHRGRHLRQHGFQQPVCHTGRMCPMARPPRWPQ